MLTTLDVAQRLGVTVRRVQALIHAGRLPATKYGRDWLIAEEALVAVTLRPTGRPRHKDTTPHK